MTGVQTCALPISPLTIAADNVTKTYGQTATLSAFTPTGLQNGETVGSATLASSGAAATAGVGSSPYGISITGATGGTFDPANYAITYAPGTLTVGKATLTVTPGASKTYDGRGYAGGAVTYSGFVNSEGAADLGGTLAFGGAAQGATNAGTYALTASGQTSANYDIVYGGGNLVINPAPLTIAADNVTKTYGQTATLAAFTPTGLQNGETVGSATLASSGAAATAGVGSSPYGITITGATGGTFNAANYAITYAPGTLTVNKATLTVTALPASKVQGGRSEEPRLNSSHIPLSRMPSSA